MSWESDYAWVTGEEAPTASHTKKAGDRIRRVVERGETPAPDDLLTLDRVRAWHGLIHRPVLTRLEAAIRRGMPAGQLTEVTIAGRPLKTREAIIAKLVREKSRLNRIQDIVGARVIVPSVAAQELVLDLVLAEFACSPWR